MKNRVFRNVACLVAGIIPAAGCASSGGPAAGTMPAAASGTSATDHPYVYVANQSSASVSVIDMVTDEVVETVDLQALGFSANAKPHHIVVEPDGSFWYVSLIADGFVLKFDRDNELVGRAAFETPGLLALDPSDDRLYVGRSMAAVNPPQRIGEIERSSMDLEEIDVFIARPHAILVLPDGSHVYTASLASNDMVSYMPSSGDTELIKVPGPAGHPHTFVQFALSPDGRRMVVGGEMTNEVLVLDATQETDPPVIATIDVPAGPWHPAFSPDGSRVYFPNQRANTVTEIDTSDWSIVREIEDSRFAGPHGIAMSPDGRKLYVGNRNEKPAADGGAAGNGFVAVIDTASGRVTKLIEVGAYASGMGAASSR
ncbi:MAG: YncE family protein [Gemmatimonadota bacterium]